jgi:hypothetical protein
VTPCLKSKILLLAIALAAQLAAQPQTTPSKTTEVMVMLTVKPGISREQIAKVLPEEVRATVRLYLDGRIRQWFSRSDGKGVMFILDSKDVAEAAAVMEQLPLAKEKLADYEFTPLSPLAPLSVLLAAPPAGQ